MKTISIEGNKWVQLFDVIIELTERKHKLSKNELERLELHRKKLERMLYGIPV